MVVPFSNHQTMKNILQRLNYYRKLPLQLEYCLYLLLLQRRNLRLQRANEIDHKKMMTLIILNKWQPTFLTKPSQIISLLKSFIINKFGLGTMGPDWSIYWTLGKFLKPLATIYLPKSPTFLGNFQRDVKSSIFLLKLFLGNFIDIWQ